MALRPWPPRWITSPLSYESVMHAFCYPHSHSATILFVTEAHVSNVPKVVSQMQNGQDTAASFTNLMFPDHFTTIIHVVREKW